MNFVATLEECLRDLAYMARPNNNSSKRLPGVKEASERAIQKLRQLQVGYISAIRKASSTTPNADPDASSQHPTTSIFQSSDLLHPFLLALNYPNADFKLVEISLRAIRLLMEADAIVPTDSIHILRVYQIQAIVVTTFYNNKLMHQIQHNQRSSVVIPALYGNEDDDEPNDATDAVSKDEAESIEGSDITPSSSVDDVSKTVASEATKTTAAVSSTSWFSWGSSTAVNTRTPLSTRGSFTIKRNAVSSSSGGVGATSLSAQHMEKLALEILSSLVQLMELLRTYHPTVLNSFELWTNATALACLFGFQWYTPYQQHHIGQVSLSAVSAATNANSSSSTAGIGSSRQSTVQQAASSTVSQLMSLLFFCQSDQNGKIIQSTWEDLLMLVNSSHTSSISIDQQRKLSSSLTLSGAFKLCKRKATLFDESASNVAEPPSPEFALELMTQLLKETMSGHNGFSPTEQLVMKSMGITLSMIQKLSQKITVEKSLRIVQWTLTLIQAHATSYRNECRELFVQLIKQIPFTTDACRTYPDFEDGYVYSSLNDDSKHEGNKRKSSVDLLATFFPLASLWKTGFVLEAIYVILDRGIADELSIFLDDAAIVQNLVESLGDFATIGTSCHDHILQVVDFCDLQIPSSIKPTIFRKAEQSIAMGINFSFGVSASSADTSTSLKSSSIDRSNKGPAQVLGEIIWLSLQGILRINDCLLQRTLASSTLDSGFLFREIFPSSLSIWQHVLKRFVGSEEIVQLALRGYSTMADICLSVQECSIERKVLLTSLSKLSLPSWGKHDASALLQDHHVRSLLCLLRIIHVHYNYIMTEWEVILWTFEELSVLNVASPLLSNETYHASLAIAAVYERFASFSTCFSDESINQVVVALSNICESTMAKRDLVGDSDTVLHERSKQVLDLSEIDHATIGEKIMSTAVRAFYGSSSGDAERTDETPRLERTKKLYYQEYRVDLLNRVSKSKFTLRTNSIGRIPFVLVVLMDVAMSNMFRPKDCRRAISRKLSELAAASPIVRPLVMDIVTMLMMSQLSFDSQLPVLFIGPGRVVVEDPMHSQLLAVEETPTAESLHHDFSQSEVLAPLCSAIIASERADIAIASLDCLTSILEGTGQNLSGEVWSLMIDAIASLSGDQSYGEGRATSDWAGCCLAAFRSLKLIVNDFLGQLPIASSDSYVEGVAAHVSLLECCCSFVTSRHDVNTSLTAIGLLWTIADQDTDTESIDRALSKLVSLSSDDRPEVRNAVVNTFFSCIAGRGGGFTPSYWESCMKSKVFRLYEVVTEKLCDDCEPAVDGLDGAKMTSRYHVKSHHTRDSSAKLWVATQVIVLQGLVRILRIFFGQLLETDAETEGPWLRVAWAKILEFSLDAASQVGGRENLEIRLTGVELLVLCCQLSCQGGIQAGGTPARVSTNMEVVNGALRTVRDSPPSKLSLQRSSSLLVDGLRQSLFLVAFETLEIFESKVLLVRKAEDDTDLQVLSKLCVNLGRLYDCGRDNEFKPEREANTKGNLFSSSGQQETNVEMTSASLESRFARIVVSAMDVSTVDLKARYLNQGQRGCFDVLRAMASSGSSIAFERLVNYADSAFFVRKDGDGEESEIADEYDKTFLTLLNFEAATLVSQEICQENVSDKCKAIVLYEVMGIFLADRIPKRRHYKIFIPILQSGAEGALQLSATSDQQLLNIFDVVWKRLLECLSLMFTPIQIGEDLWKISRVSELLTVVAIVKENVPQACAIDLCILLSTVAIKVYEIAGKHAVFGALDPESAFGRKSKRHRDDLLKLFSICFSSGCELGPEENCIASVASTVFSSNSNAAVESMQALGVDATICICQALEERMNINTLIVSVFPHLCALILSENVRLKQAAGNVLTKANIAAFLQESQSRCKEAEKRANDAEKEVKDLEAIVYALQREKVQLQEELILANESPRRGLW
jgi:C-terminal region of Mon2 protein